MADEPKKIFDLMDTETEPTDEQLAELMHYVGEAVRAESARIRARSHFQSVNDAVAKPESHGPTSSTTG